MYKKVKFVNMYVTYYKTQIYNSLLSVLIYNQSFYIAQKVVQWMSENRTSGLPNRTKKHPVFESSGYRTSGWYQSVRISDI